MVENLNKPNKKESFFSLFSWKMTEDDLKYQVENYKTLRISHSYRGISILIMSFFLTITLVTSFLGWIDSKPSDILYGLILYIPILLFIYKGHRWAIIVLMALWTIEKGYQIVKSGGEIITMPLLYWLFFMPYLYKTLKVENERRKKSIIQ